MKKQCSELKRPTPVKVWAVVSLLAALTALVAVLVDVAAAAVTAAAAFADIGAGVIFSQRSLLYWLVLPWHGASRQSLGKWSNADVIPDEEVGWLGLVATGFPLGDSIIFEADADDLLHTAVASFGRGHHIGVKVEFRPIPIRMVQAEVRPLGHCASFEVKRTLHFVAAIL